MIYHFYLTQIKSSPNNAVSRTKALPILQVPKWGTVTFYIWNSHFHQFLCLLLCKLAVTHSCFGCREIKTALWTIFTIFRLKKLIVLLWVASAERQVRKASAKAGSALSNGVSVAKHHATTTMGPAIIASIRPIGKCFEFDAMHHWSAPDCIRMFSLVMDVVSVLIPGRLVLAIGVDLMVFRY